MAINRDIASINIHVLSNNPNSNFYNPITDAIYVRRNTFGNVSRRQSFPHEVGHFFGLSHTHRFHNFGPLAEPVTRDWAWSINIGFPPIINVKHCSWTGDFLCDTPADPNMSSDIDFQDTDGDMDLDLYFNTIVPWSVTASRRYIGRNIVVNNPATNTIGPVVDAFSAIYRPLEQNIMSYANRPFRNNLTISQKAIIVDDLEKRDVEIWESQISGFP